MLDRLSLRLIDRTVGFGLRLDLSYMWDGTGSCFVHFLHKYENYIADASIKQSRNSNIMIVECLMIKNPDVDIVSLIQLQLEIFIQSQQQKIDYNEN